MEVIVYGEREKGEKEEGKPGEGEQQRARCFSLTLCHVQIIRERTMSTHHISTATVASCLPHCFNEIQCCHCCKTSRAKNKIFWKNHSNRRVELREGMRECRIRRDTNDREAEPGMLFLSFCLLCQPLTQLMLKACVGVWMCGL